jgi:hypothetical protein
MHATVPASHSVTRFNRIFLEEVLDQQLFLGFYPVSTDGLIKA